MHQCLESRIVPEAVERRHSQKGSCITFAIFKALLEPFERQVLVSEMSVDVGEGKGVREALLTLSLEHSRGAVHRA